ncbi:MAG: hypothetical protein PVG07_16090, partial [Acidobacteriota bacterium]
MSSRLPRRGGPLAWAALLLMATAPVAGAVEGLSLVGAQEDSLQLAVPASGLVPLVFHRTPAEGAAVFDVDLGAFLSEDDQSASVAIRPLQDDLDGQDGRAG